MAMTVIITIFNDICKKYQQKSPITMSLAAGVSGTVEKQEQNLLKTCG